MTTCVHLQISIPVVHNHVNIETVPDYNSLTNFKWNVKCRNSSNSTFCDECHFCKSPIIQANFTAISNQTSIMKLWLSLFITIYRAVNFKFDFNMILEGYCCSYE